MENKTTIFHDKDNFKNIWVTNNRITVSVFNIKFLEQMKNKYLSFLSVPSVYILRGEEKNLQAKQKIYIGETAVNCLDRWQAQDHQIKEEWVDEVIVISSNNDKNQLSKDQLRFIENVIINNTIELNKDGAADLLNETKSTKMSLSDIEEAILRSEIELIYKFLKLLNKEIIQTTSDESPMTKTDSELINTKEHVKVEFSHRNKASRATARYYPDDKTIIVETGSIYDGVRQESASDNIKKRLDKFYNESNEFVKKSDNNSWEIVKEVKFKTSSGAATMFQGGSASGPLAWKLKDSKKQLKDIL